MRILFCNVTYLKFYDGRIVGEYKPKSGGRWVRENEDAHEKWNFLNMDGYCYGYVQGNGDQMHIEKLDKVYSQQEEAEDITVVWCASHPTRGTVVVGWYEHATVYRYIHDMLTTPITGIERCYWFRTKAENAYLLPEDERVIEIGRAAKTGSGTGFGQQNYWFADSVYAKEIIIPKVMRFIEEHRDSRINVLTDAFNEPDVLSPLTQEEIDRAEELGDDENMEYLPYAYRMYAANQNADNAYRIAATLKNLFQYRMSIVWFEKTIELDPEDWETTGILVYVYQQCEEFQKSVSLAKRLLECPRISEPDFRDEVYCIMADDYFFSGDIEEAIKWQDKILKESKNKDLIEHTKNIKCEWKKNLK